MSCLVSKYKDSGAVALKNNLEWLQGFIKQSSLYYSCQRCSDPFNFSGKSIANVHRESRTRNSDISSGTFTAEQQILQNEFMSVKSSIPVMSGCLSQITRQMSELKSSLQPLPDKSSQAKSSTVQINASSMLNGVNAIPSIVRSSCFRKPLRQS